MSCEECETTILEMVALHAKLSAAELELERMTPVVVAAEQFVRAKMEGQRVFMEDALATRELAAVQHQRMVDIAVVFERHAKRLQLDISRAAAELDAAVTSSLRSKERQR